VSAVAGATRISIDRAIAIAEDALPGAFASNVGLPAGSKGVFRIFKKFPEDRTPAGRSRVVLDQFSGAVLQVENTRTAPLGTRILNLKRSAHTGDIFGAPTQALYFLVSLGIALQAMSGALIWWNGKRREGTPLPRPLRCLRLPEINEPAIDVHAGQPHAQAIADVEAGM